MFFIKLNYRKNIEVNIEVLYIEINIYLNYKII